MDVVSSFPQVNLGYSVEKKMKAMDGHMDRCLHGKQWAGM
jgi:hypothetical protein